LVAIESVRKYGKENVILLNHDISSHVEHADIKRFKVDVAEYLGLPITYANAEDFEQMTPIAVSLRKKAFSVGNGRCFCTHHLKTYPFEKWIKKHFPVPAPGHMVHDDVTILYGFDAKEWQRAQRRRGILLELGYDSDYPLAWKERTISATEEIGIKRPQTYDTWLHANCQGCLKAGKQHWYVVYCLRPDIWEEAKTAESVLGHSIIKNHFLHELEEQFEYMKNTLEILPTDKTPSAQFWKRVKNTLPEQLTIFSCDWCAI